MVAETEGDADHVGEGGHNAPMRATGIGSHPGEDAAAFDEAVRVVLGELPDLPYLPELPARGPIASLTGRGVAVVSGLGADLQPAGWRLTDGPGVDHRRARSLLAQDLDAFEEQAQAFHGTVKLQVAGPWTLAATVEKPRGDKVLSDHGARRELAQALAEGVVDHVADVRRRVPAAVGLVVQVDEPMLPAVLGARVPTASGFGRHRAVDRPEAFDTLGWVLSAITDAGAEAWVHSCAPGTPWALVRDAGATGLSADVAQLSADDLDALAETLDAGATVALGVVPPLDTPTSEAQVTESTLRLVEMLGLDPGELGHRLVVSPACGLAGASPSWPRRALAISAAAARSLS